MFDLIINHHFFYNQNEKLGFVFKGQNLSLFYNQIQSLKNNNSSFAISVDDGSKSFLNIIDILIRENIKCYLAVNYNTIIQRKVLLAHKILLIKHKLNDYDFWSRLCAYFKYDFSKEIENSFFYKENIYKFDNELVRSIRIVLNYILYYEEALEFINSLFNEFYIDEQGLADKLYLSENELKQLLPYVEPVFHGNEHKFWANLNACELKQELNIDKEFRKLFPKRYFIAVPFGFSGSYNKMHITRFVDKDIKGIFTMEKKLKNEYDKKNNLLWVHRFDQADIEDIYDSAVIAEREKQDSVSLNDLKKMLKKDGFI